MCRFVKLLASRCERNALADLLEQRHSNDVRQLLDLCRNSGLRQKKLLRRAGEVFAARDGFKNSQLVQGSVSQGGFTP